VASVPKYVSAINGPTENEKALAHIAPAVGLAICRPAKNKITAENTSDANATAFRSAGFGSIMRNVGIAAMR
jgi:hypothetical protein